MWWTWIWASSRSWWWTEIHKLDHKEGWVPKEWCYWTVVLKKTLGSPLDCKEIKPVNPKANQPWIFIGRTDAEAPILWPLNAEPTHQKMHWCWERLTAKGEKSGWGWDGWMASPTQWTWILSKLQELVKDREAWHAAIHWVTNSWTWLSNWTTKTRTEVGECYSASLNMLICFCLIWLKNELD